MLEFFTDPILRAPTIGCMLMGLTSGLIGCLAFLQKRSLVGEALSHAAYPGVVLGAMLLSQGSILLGAFLSGLLGLLCIHQMEKRLKIASDAALCFVLSVFFGIGVCIASGLQVSHALWLQKIQVFLLGQAATMLDGHILVYGTLALICILSIVALFRFLEILHFDPEFAKAVGLPAKATYGVLYLLLMVAIVIGMRSVGVVLMSSMLIAPPAAARQWTTKFSSFLILSGALGLVSGFLGNAFVVWLPMALPTGPMIALVATVICLFSLFFAPERGFLPKLIRITHFQLRCKQENILKALYKSWPIPSNPYLLWRMRAKGWVRGGELTPEGHAQAEKLVRLHRLWEVYLVHMGQESDRVHHSAEEMEHILTPEIEVQLQALLDNPTTDPHEQPIP
ncbi:MAG: metal ABC transporter permease [Simkaniaceae bacterium]|nr:metal ABC transporter permease [Candidatus Sacchlamyda saccharinae]